MALGVIFLGLSRRYSARITSYNVCYTKLLRILPAGTPYAQIIPFKRENWVSEIDVSLTLEEMTAKNKENSAKYRKPDGGVYMTEVWERRKYQ